MNMRILAVLLVATSAISLTACKRDASAPVSDTAKPAASRAAEPASTDLAGRKLATPLPKGITLDFPYHLRQDIVETSKDGRKRRKVTVEYLQGTPQDIRTSVGAALKGAGLELQEESTTRDGGARLKYRLKGFGTVVVSIPSTKRDKYRNPAAQGHMSLDFPVADE
jgi:pyruvate/2-oxoglutarate dehydrogenase complex dihydrolipoamide acyltransferase (E2) component